MCMLHAKQQKPVRVYLALRIFTEFSEFLILELSYKGAWNLCVYSVMCVRSFLNYYVT